MTRTATFGGIALVLAAMLPAALEAVGDPTVRVVALVVAVALTFGLGVLVETPEVLRPKRKAPAEPPQPPQEPPEPPERPKVA
jgi:hypothetical protein